MSSTNKSSKRQENPSGQSVRPAAKPHWKTKTNHLADLMPKILTDVVARKTGMNLDLIAAWEDIAGPDYAFCTRAEKINWPRKSSELDPFQPGILIVACDNAKAIFFQHELPQVIERINLFFGFEAISKIKIIQKPIKIAKKQRNQIPEKLDENSEGRLQNILKNIDDPDLRQKIAKFGRGVINKNKSAR